MKYSDLIEFNPIESVIKLTSANDRETAAGLVKSYVMSDKMAKNISVKMLSQLRLDDAIDSKGVLLVGNYGTGKSHLMSLLSAIAQDVENLNYLQNRVFADSAKSIAGRFEVLRIEIGSSEASLRNIILSEVQQDFAERGLSFSYPAADQITSNEKTILEMMALFATKYQAKGYLIVVDELLDFLAGKDEHALRFDLVFLRELGKITGTSRLRVIFGMQEKLFDNPKFSFVANNISRVRDRFEQMIIYKEDAAFVVSERILKKTMEQKAWIRDHLQNYCSLYANMSERLEEFVELYPIHPAFIDVFTKIIHIENRHILRNISNLVGSLLNEQVPTEAPGVYSFDSYWEHIREDFALRTDPSIRDVVEKSDQLESILNRSFPKQIYKSLALKIIRALSVHRLTTIDVTVRSGLTSENLRDDLCLYIANLPDRSSDTMQGLVQTVLKDIMTTVSGQFLEHNTENGQYFLDLKKDIDYDENIRLRAATLSSSSLERYFFDTLYHCLDWGQNAYVAGFRIYDHNLIWVSHSIFRMGYLFLGTPKDRPTAQPPRDYYLYFLPLFGDCEYKTDINSDEVFFTFKPNEEFLDNLRLYAAARIQQEQADATNRVIYQNKAEGFRKCLAKYLTENRNTCFEVLYRGKTRKFMEVMQSRYKQGISLKETIDLVASLLLDAWFAEKYPDFPEFKTILTQQNHAETAERAIYRFAGQTHIQANAMLESFGLLDGDTIDVKYSPYAAYYIDLLKKQPVGKVLNFGDIYYEENGAFLDKRFKLSNALLPIVLLGLVYCGYADITLRGGTLLTASNLDILPKTTAMELQEFKTISRPKELRLEVLERLFEILDLPVGQMRNPASREAGVGSLLQKAKSLTESAAKAIAILNSNFSLWGEALLPSHITAQYKEAAKRVSAFFGDFHSKFNSVAKLNNFTHTIEAIEQIGKDIEVIEIIQEFDAFRSDCSSIVDYCMQLTLMDLDEALRNALTEVRQKFTGLRDAICAGADGLTQSNQVNELLNAVQKRYIDAYLVEHRKCRLGVNEAKQKKAIIDSAELSSLDRLSTIEIFSASKLKVIKDDLAALTICYDATPQKLLASPLCPACHFRLGNGGNRPARAALDRVEDRIDALLREWTHTLLRTLDDPHAVEQQEFLDENQRRIVRDFISSKTLPEKVDTFFVEAIKALLQGFQPVTIFGDDLMDVLAALGPCDLATFKRRIDAWISLHTQGKDQDKLRIIIKR